MTDLDLLTYDFLRDDAGSPLGVGMPSGGPLREDGQSHYEAWQALLRRDPCSYCGDDGASGTVDHVDPRSRKARGIGTVHGWINTVGACERCNGAKRDVVRRDPEGCVVPVPYTGMSASMCSKCPSSARMQSVSSPAARAAAASSIDCDTLTTRSRAPCTSSWGTRSGRRAAGEPRS